MQAHEEKLVRSEPGAPKDVCAGLKIPLTVSEVAFLVEEVYRSRSAVSGLATRLHLVRWRKPRAGVMKTLGEGADQQKWTTLQMSDLVCLTKEEVKMHDKEVLQGGKSPEDVYDADTVRKVEARIEEIKEYEKYR